MMKMVGNNYKVTIRITKQDNEVDVKSTLAHLKEAAFAAFEICVMVDSNIIRKALLNPENSPWETRSQARALSREARNLNIFIRRGFDESVRIF